MSYILDALNKSEQEQRSRKAPGLDAVHGLPVRSALGSGKMAVLAAILVAVNAAAIYWFVYYRVDAPPTRPESVSVSEDLPVLPVESPGIETPTHLSSVTELPVNIQQKISDISLSSHIYAQDPSLRMVNINGRSVRQGDAIIDGITLVEITEEGVVLRYLSYTFELNIIRDWSIR